MSRERDPGEGEALREASRRAVRAFEGVESVLKQTVTRWDAAEVVEPISGKKRPKDWINLRYWAREVVGVIVREDAVRTWERIAYGDDIPDGKALLDGIMKFTLSPCTHISHEFGLYAELPTNCFVNMAKKLDYPPPGDFFTITSNIVEGMELAGLSGDPTSVGLHCIVSANDLRRTADVGWKDDRLLMALHLGHCFSRREGDKLVPTAWLAARYPDG